MPPTTKKRRSRTPVGPYRLKDLRARVNEGQKADLLNGVIYISPPETFAGGVLFLRLVTLLADYVEEFDLGHVCCGRIAFRLAEREVPEPDIAFIRKQREGIIERCLVNGPPDLAMEIVTPESIERDYELKRNAYQRAGVEEYWIVDEMEEKAYLLRLTKAGMYEEVRPLKGALVSRVVPGFYLRPEWLWRRPLPKKKDILRELLASRR
jgi:Uma2 family endonuclease